MIVVDVNVVISSLLTKGDSFKVFAINFMTKKFDFIAPELLLLELNNHKKEIISRSKISEDDFNEVKSFIIEQISFIPRQNFEDCLDNAKKILSNHQKDIPYLALAMKTNCPIFSGDKILKELSPIDVYNPKEMLDKFNR